MPVPPGDTHTFLLLCVEADQRGSVKTLASIRGRLAVNCHSSKEMEPMKAFPGKGELVSAASSCQAPTCPAGISHCYDGPPEVSLLLKIVLPWVAAHI